MNKKIFQVLLVAIITIFATSTVNAQQEGSGLSVVNLTWEKGGISANTGFNYPYKDEVRTIGFTPFNSNCSGVRNESDVKLIGYMYDENYKYMHPNLLILPNETLKYLPAEAKYIRFVMVEPKGAFPNIRVLVEKTGTSVNPWESGGSGGAVIN